MARNRRSRDRKRTSGDEKRVTSTTSTRAASRLIQDAGSIAFTWPTGSTFSLAPEHNPFSNMIPLDTVYRQGMPGVMAFYTMPILGRATSPNDAATIAARSVYSFVRHANSGHANYDPPDYMMYVLAMDSVLSFYAWMVRAYGIMRAYSQINLYTPETILHAMGINATAMHDRISDFRSYINTFAAKASAFCVPNVFSYFQKHFDLYSNIYLDDRSARGQFYLFNPWSLLKYDETSGKGKLTVLPLSFENGLLTARHDMGLPEIKAIGDELLNAILASEDMGIMSGDTLKAYGDANLIKLSQISEDYTVTPIYDELMLNRIANIHSVCLNYANIKGADWVTQSDDGVIICHPHAWNGDVYQNAQYLLPCKRIVRSMLESPTPDQVLEMTAFTVIADAYEPASTSVVVEVAGDTIINSMEVTYWGHTVSSYTPLNIPIYTYELKTKHFDNLFNPLDLIDHEREEMFTMLSKFAWHPMLYLVSMQAENPDETGNIYLDIIGYEGDMDNYAIVGHHALEKIHNARIMDELSVPLFGVG